MKYGFWRRNGCRGGGKVEFGVRSNFFRRKNFDVPNFTF